MRPKTDNEVVMRPSDFWLEGVRSPRPETTSDTMVMAKPKRKRGLHAFPCLFYPSSFLFKIKKNLSCEQKVLNCMLTCPNYTGSNVFNKRINCIYTSTYKLELLEVLNTHFKKWALLSSLTSNTVLIWKHLSH